MPFILDNSVAMRWLFDLSWIVPAYRLSPYYA